MVSENLNFKCILVIGATASGKTGLAHSIADELALQNIKCELVNCDAFQIYNELTIGTAKPTTEEIKKYKYHGLNLSNIDEHLNSHSFAKHCWQACELIYKKGAIPICVGGSGLYLRSFLHGLDDFPNRDVGIRNQIQEFALLNGWGACHEWLKKVDPIRAQELHPNDKIRIERSLEVFLQTGQPQSSMRSKEQILKEQSTLFPCYTIRVHRNVDELKNRIKQRVEVLLAENWEKEVALLYEKYGEKLFKFHSMQAIGYKQILQSYLQNNPNLKQEIITATWHYAKKQRTWFAKEKVDYEVKSDNLLDKELMNNLSDFFKIRNEF